MIYISEMLSKANLTVFLFAVVYFPSPSCVIIVEFLTFVHTVKNEVHFLLVVFWENFFHP